ncbi:MFS transporter [Inquilinus limosus]|nr:MFS transporter [Inquilinus limosus]
MSQPEPGWGTLFSGANAIRSLALAGGTALHAVSVYIAITILPSVVKDIGGLDYYAWNTTLFVAASILGAALSPRLLAVLGPRGAYVAAALTFAAGAMACGLAPTMPVLLLGRLVQGLGGGVMLALSYAMIRLILPEALWSRGMGLVSAMWGIATLLGPAIGGVFAELGVWRAAFWCAAPLAVLFALLAASVLPKRGEAGDRAALPLLQLVLLTVAVLVVSAGSVSADIRIGIAGLAVALALMAALIGVERRARTRLLPRDIFRLSTPLSRLFVVMSLLTVTVTGTEIFIPLFLQVLHQQTPLVSGYLAALMSAGWSAGSITSSGAGGRAAGRAILASPVLALAGMACLAALVPVAGGGDWALLAPICVALVCIGLGIGSAWPHLLTRALQTAPEDERTLTASSLTTVQMFVTALAAALAGMVANLGGLLDPGGVAGTASAARWLFGLVALAPLLCLPVALRVGRARPAARRGHASSAPP